jgi:hypothetical protein
MAFGPPQPYFDTISIYMNMDHCLCVSGFLRHSELLVLNSLIKVEKVVTFLMYLLAVLGGKG